MKPYPTTGLAPPYFAHKLIPPCVPDVMFVSAAVQHRRRRQRHDVVVALIREQADIGETRRQVTALSDPTDNGGGVTCARHLGEAGSVTLVRKKVVSHRNQLEDWDRLNLGDGLFGLGRTLRPARYTWTRNPGG
ncbi:hypothetical protein Aduo_002494 [Ancylostoma duodenale]